MPKSPNFLKWVNLTSCDFFFSIEWNFSRINFGSFLARLVRSHATTRSLSNKLETFYDLIMPSINGCLVITDGWFQWTRDVRGWGWREVMFVFDWSGNFVAWSSGPPQKSSRILEVVPKWCQQENLVEDSFLNCFILKNQWTQEIQRKIFIIKIIMLPSLPNNHHAITCQIASWLNVYERLESWNVDKNAFRMFFQLEQHLSSWSNNLVAEQPRLFVVV